VTDLYSAPLADLRYEELRGFVLALEQADALTESAVLELKRERTGKNVVEAVAAMYNTDGGLVLVGVDEKARGEARFVGVPPEALDEIVNQLSALLDPRGLVPDIANVALPGGTRVVTVVRVPPGSAHVPVLVGGKTLVRLPGQSVPADRRAVLELVSRSGRRSYGRAGQVAFDPANIRIWAGADPDVELRLWGRVVMAPSVADRFRFDTARQDAVLDALDGSPLTELLHAPDAQERLAPPPGGRPDREWSRYRARSVQLICRRGDPGAPGHVHPLGAGRVLLQASGPYLHWLLAVGASPVLLDRHARAGRGVPAERVPGEAGNALRWSAQDVHDLAALGMLAGAAAARAAAVPAGTGTPVEISPVEGLVRPLGPNGAADVLDLRLDGFAGRQPDSAEPGHLEPARQPVRPEGASALAKDWIADMLVDSGATGFEARLAAFTLP
jgi:hypothetical protein